MPKIVVTGDDGEVRELQAEAGRTLMETLRESGVGEILALCGGCCSCATCHVYVDQSLKEHLPPMSADEDMLLEGAEHREPTSRLSCQIRITDALDGLRVKVAPQDG